MNEQPQVRAIIELKCSLYIRELQSLLAYLRQEKEHDFRRPDQRPLKDDMRTDLYVILDQLEKTLLMREDY